MTVEMLVLCEVVQAPALRVMATETTALQLEALGIVRVLDRSG